MKIKEIKESDKGIEIILDSLVNHTFNTPRGRKKMQRHGYSQEEFLKNYKRGYYWTLDNNKKNHGIENK